MFTYLSCLGLWVDNNIHIWRLLWPLPLKYFFYFLILLLLELWWCLLFLDCLILLHRHCIVSLDLSSKLTGFFFFVPILLLIPSSGMNFRSSMFRASWAMAQTVEASPMLQCIGNLSLILGWGRSMEEELDFTSGILISRITDREPEATVCGCRESDTAERLSLSLSSAQSLLLVLLSGLAFLC